MKIFMRSERNELQKNNPNLSMVDNNWANLQDDEQVNYNNHPWVADLYPLVLERKQNSVS